MSLMFRSLIFVLFIGTQCAAADGESAEVDLDGLTVKGIKPAGFVEQAPDDPATATIISQDTVDLLTGPARTNPYRALDLLPSVHSENVDAFSLTEDQNSLRIRGQIGDTLTRLSRTIDGIPLGINVSQRGMGNLIDLDNLEGMELNRGAVRPDKGFGFGTTAGALDQFLRWGSKNPELMLLRSDGSEHFNRTFFRADSGELATKTRLFTSASYSSVDKWRGEGYGERTNVSAGISQPLPGNTSVSVYGLFNSFRQHDYRPLTYEQTLSESYYRNYDYATDLAMPVDTSTMRQNVEYYQYNRQKFNEYAILSIIETRPTASSAITIKPYYAWTDGYRLVGKQGATGAKSSISRIDIAQEQVGFTSEYRITLGPSRVKLGYWFQNADTMPPPTSQKSYQVTGNGLEFKSWGILSKVEDRIFHEPYLMVENRFGKLKVDAGLKYVRISLPEITGYDTKGLGDISYEDAIAASSGPVAALHADGSAQDAWLPYLGVRYDFDNDTNLRLSYGRNYAEGWLGPLYSTFKNKQAAFTAAGINLQDLWDGVKLEISDNLDLGARFGGDTWHVAPTLFYGTFHDKQVLVYDERVKTSYYQSNASAESMGAELEVGFAPVSWLSFFGSASYNRFRFDDNIQTASGTMVQSKGKQVADVPEWMGKVGLTARYAGFSVTPVLRYIGKRYGDIENKERVADYEVVDLTVAYSKKNIWGFRELTASLSLLNLFDKRYISIIKNNQDISEALATSYYPGAPFTVAGTVSIKF